MVSITDDDAFVAWGGGNYDYLALGRSGFGFVTQQDQNGNPMFRVGCSVAGDLYGVYGQVGPGEGSAAEPGPDRSGYATNVGVLGVSTQFTGVAGTTDGFECGVYGQSGDNQGIPPGLRAGVLGCSRLASGVRGWSFQDYGVGGESTTGSGVWGGSQRAVGVSGQTGGFPFGPQFTDPRNPTVPDERRGGPAGVKGTATEDFGVVGTSFKASGVLGQSGGPPLFDQKVSYVGGVTGSSLAVSGLVGVSQKSFGVLATSRDNHGVWGSSGKDIPTVAFSPNTLVRRVAGVLGTSHEQVGVMGLSTAQPGIVGYAVDNVGIYGESQKHPAGFFNGAVTVTGALTAASKSAIVPFPDGSRRVLHCMESPEHWFEDFGSGKLRRGRAVVKLDGDFAKVVKLSDYRVFLTPEGDCRGLYVRKRRGPTFEVRELQEGDSSVAFSYRIVGKRKDITGHKRFARIDLGAPRSLGRTRVPLLAAMTKARKPKRASRR
jgi:hypothetical protein